MMMVAKKLSLSDIITLCKGDYTKGYLKAIIDLGLEEPFMDSLDKRITRICMDEDEVFYEMIYKSHLVTYELKDRLIYNENE